MDVDAFGCSVCNSADGFNCSQVPFYQFEIQPLQYQHVLQVVQTREELYTVSYQIHICFKVKASHTYSVISYMEQSVGLPAQPADVCQRNSFI